MKYNGMLFRSTFTVWSQNILFLSSLCYIILFMLITARSSCGLLTFPSQRKGYYLVVNQSCNLLFIVHLYYLLYWFNMNVMHEVLVIGLFQADCTIEVLKAAYSSLINLSAFILIRFPVHIYSSYTYML